MPTWNSRGLRGSTLEDLLNRTNEKYAENGLALIQKIPTPITPITIDKDSLNNSLNEADAAIRDFFARKKYTIKINAKEDNNTAPNLDDLNKTTDEYIKRCKQLRKEIKQLSDPKADKENYL